MAPSRGSQKQLIAKIARSRGGGSAPDPRTPPPRRLRRRPSSEYAPPVLSSVMRFALCVVALAASACDGGGSRGESCDNWAGCPELPDRLLGGERGGVYVYFTTTGTQALASLTASVATAGGVLEDVQDLSSSASWPARIYATVDRKAAEVICAHGQVESANNGGGCPAVPD